ncbi:MATE efflux family protein [Klebsormidium nitens]|uniref:Protein DETOXIFICATION n=1 Tax=Klebsormidium nitens TaxID=105231 RepID=A0A1Y1IG60_KLENI|nr:MATE efflux family protein [Klebsormidium nitens]|eukprot:GAQ89633.1 MATE efflux family protein [Klebsormidium nitens]
MEQPLLPGEGVTGSLRSQNGVCAPYDPGPGLPPGAIGPALPGTPCADSREQSDEEAAADEPLHKLSGMQQVRREAHKQWRLALPICTMNVFNVLLAMVSVIFVGHLGAKELAAGALATGVANVTGIAVLEGLSGAIGTFCGQAFGAGQYMQLGHVLQRGLIINTLFCIPIAALWIHAEQILLLWGQSPRLAAMATQYMVRLIPGLLGSAWLYPTAQFIQAQGITVPQALTSGVTLALHIPSSYVFIYGLNLGFTGAAIANSVSCFFSFSLLVAYLMFERSGILKRCWPGWSLLCFTEWAPFLSIAVPACLMTCLEWWCMQLITILSGLLPDPEVQVSAMTICFNTAALCFMLPLGLSTAVSVRVSNELGAGKPGRARLAVQTSMSIALVLGVVLAGILLALRNKWALVFADPREVHLIALVAKIMPLLVVSQFGVGLQAILSGVLRGSGQQFVGSVINFVSYYGIAVPAMVLFAFRLDLRLQGLWFGLMLGVGLQTLMLLILTCRTDWSLQADRARKRVEAIARDRYSPVLC